MAIAASEDLGLLNVLIVEDNEQDQKWIRGLVDAMGVKVCKMVGTAPEAEQALSTSRYNCVILDEDLPPDGRFQGLKILESKDARKVFVIMLTIHDQDLRTALLHGARRFMEKGEVLADSNKLRRALYDAALFLKTQLSVVYQTDVMIRFFQRVAAVARTNDPVLILGESGSGKDLVAHAIHKLSARAGGPYEALNCACLDQSTAEADLFGVAKGGFTDTSPRPGIFERAQEGTAFFDEIGELGRQEQSRLLRILEHPEELQRAGGHERVVFKGAPVNFRAVFATDRDLRAAVAAQRFHAPLYERISAQVLKVPSLNERRDDIPLLAGVYLDRHKSTNVERLSNDAIEALCRMDWVDKNVRGLWHTISNALVIAETREEGNILAEVTSADVLKAYGELDIRRDVPDAHDAHLTQLAGQGASLEQVEALYIQAVLDKAGSIAAAANQLGMGRNTLYDKIRRLKLKKPGDDPH